MINNGHIHDDTAPGSGIPATSTFTLSRERLLANDIYSSFEVFSRLRRRESIKNGLHLVRQKFSRYSIEGNAPGWGLGLGGF